MPKYLPFIVRIGFLVEQEHAHTSFSFFFSALWMFYLQLLEHWNDVTFRNCIYSIPYIAVNVVKAKETSCSGFICTSS